MSEQQLLYSVDALPPPKTIEKAIQVRVAKIELDFLTLLTLSILCICFFQRKQL